MAKRRNKRFDAYENLKGELVVNTRYITEKMMLNPYETMRVVEEGLEKYLLHDPVLIVRHTAYYENKEGDNLGPYFELSYFAFDEIFGPYANSSKDRFAVQNFLHILDQFVGAEEYIHATTKRLPKILMTLF